MEQQSILYTSDETGIDGNLVGTGGNGDEPDTNGALGDGDVDGGDGVDADESGASAGGGG